MRTTQTVKKKVQQPLVQGNLAGPTNVGRAMYQRGYASTYTDPYEPYQQKLDKTIVQQSSKQNPWNQQVARTYKGYVNAPDWKDKYGKGYDAALKNYQKNNQVVSKYADQINDVLGNILNRGRFDDPWNQKINDTLTALEGPYDPESDPLYQNYKGQYTRGGMEAMQNAMAQAAALTGGYGSSYGQSVGQQQFGQYMAALADKIPELAQAAQDMYQNRLNNYLTMSNRDYGRWADEGDWMLNQYNSLLGADAQDLQTQQWNIGNRADLVNTYANARNMDRNFYDQDLAKLYNNANLALSGSGDWQNQQQSRINNLYSLGDRLTGRAAQAYQYWQDDLARAAQAVAEQEALLKQASGGGSGSGRGGGRSGGSSKSGSGKQYDLVSTLNYMNDQGESPTDMIALMDQGLANGMPITYNGAANGYVNIPADEAGAIRNDLINKIKQAYARRGK